MMLDVDTLYNNRVRGPLEKLYNEPEKVKHLIPKARDDNPVLELFLHPYMHNSIVTDHLLGGISKCLIELGPFSVEEQGKVFH